MERKHLIIKKYSCEGRNIKYKKPHFKRSEAFLIDGLSHPEITMIKPSFSSHLDATNNIFIIKPSFNKSIFVTLNYRMSSKLLSSLCRALQISGFAMPLIIILEGLTPFIRHTLGLMEN